MCSHLAVSKRERICERKGESGKGVYLREMSADDRTANHCKKELFTPELPWHAGMHGDRLLR